MKKIILSLLAFGLMAGIASSAEVSKNLKFSWDMPNPPSDLAGYNIYSGDTIVATYTGTDLVFNKTMMIDAENTCLSITAFDKAYLTDVTNKASHESPKTAPYCINVPPNTPTMFRVTVDAVVTVENIMPKAITPDTKKIKK